MKETPYRVVPPLARIRALDPLSGLLQRPIRTDRGTYLIERYEVRGSQVRFIAVGPGKHERAFSTLEVVRQLEVDQTDLALFEPEAC